MHASTSTFIGVLALASGLATPVLGEPLSLSDVLSASVQHDQRIRAAGFEADARQAEIRAVSRKMLPTVRLEANAFLWDSAFDYQFDFAPLGEALGPLLPPGAQVDLPQMNLRVRDDFVFTFQASLVQPLSQLYRIYKGYQAKSEMFASAQAEVEAQRLNVQREASRAYFNHLQAMRARITLAQALEQVDAFEVQTQRYMKAGLVEREALLKVQVQRAELERARIEVEKGVALSGSMLNMLMGRDLETALELQCGTMTPTVAGTPCPDVPADRAAEIDLAEQQEEAVNNRPDLKSARAQRQAAGHGRKATYGKLWPDVTALLAYQNNQGTGEFMPENAVFGGVTLTWNAFEWGATYAEYDAAKSRASAAGAAVQGAEDGIRLRIKQRRLEVEGASAQIDVARAGLDLAQENLRLEEARFEAQTNTATDLLAAQTSVVKAENALNTAVLDHQAKQIELRLALGRDLTRPSRNEQ